MSCSRSDHNGLPCGEGVDVTQFVEFVVLNVVGFANGLNEGVSPFNGSFEKDCSSHAIGFLSSRICIDL